MGINTYENFCWVRKSFLGTKRVIDHQYLLCFNVFDRQFLIFGRHSTLYWFTLVSLRIILTQGSFSVAKATLQSLMSVCLSVCPLSKPLNSLKSSSFILQPSSFINLHSFFIIPHSSFLHFATFKLFSLFSK